MNKKAFTLIELFIAVSIFAVVAVALYSTFFAGISVWRRSSEGGDIYQAVRFVLDDISKDFRNVIYCSKDEKSMFAFSAGAGEAIFFNVEAALSEEGETGREMVRTAYRFNKDKNELIRIKAGKSAGFAVEKAPEEVLLRNVEDFKFEYCYNSGDDDEPYLWGEEWKDKELRIPRGIRVTLHIAGGKEKEPIEFTKTIYVPTGILGEKEVGL